jgi:DNA-binding LytR/AlgR family response regulator
MPPEIREPHGLAVRAARLAWAQLADFGTGYGVAALAGAFLAFAGEFGTDAVGFGQRLANWVPTMLFGAALGALVSGVVATRAPAQSPLLTWAAITFAVSIPLTFVVTAYTEFMFGRAPGSLPLMFGAVLVVSAAMTAIMMLLRPPTLVTQADEAQTVAHSATATGPVFLKRLPPKLMGGVLHAVEAEDHYLRLHTSKGSDLILFRLADAIAELEGVDGAQTHRSWWVARAAVQDVRRTEGRVDLVLPGGALGPVSRRNVKVLKEMGWF